MVQFLANFPGPVLFVAAIVSIKCQLLQWRLFHTVSNCSHSLLSLFHRGPSSLAGVAVICIMMPVTKAVAKYMGGLQRAMMTDKDKRIEVNSEVLGAMKVVKVRVLL